MGGKNEWKCELRRVRGKSRELQRPVFSFTDIKMMFRHVCDEVINLETYPECNSSCLTAKESRQDSKKP